MTFKLWLEKREGIGSKILTLTIPMAGAIGGGAAGLAAGGPLAALPGWIAGKKVGEKAVEKIFPKSTAELMRKH